MSRQPHIVLAGGTGFLGQILTEYFLKQGYRIDILSRAPQASRPGVTYHQWDGRTAGTWMVTLEGATALINLSGRSVDCRYTAENKAKIYASRLESTAILGEALALCEEAPPLWINLSSATYYRHAEDRPMTEADGEAGTGFSVDVVKRWEKTFFEAEVPGIRKVALRTSFVVGPQGSAYPVYRKLAKLGLGGTQGNGQQYVSWVHYHDFVRMVAWILEHPQAEGVYNASAPDPLRNHLFLKLLRQSLGVKWGLPAAKWMVKLGAWVLRTEAELILKSRQVVPQRFQEEGFTFCYPTWADASRQLAQSTPLRQAKVSDANKGTIQPSFFH